MKQYTNIPNPTPSILASTRHISLMPYLSSNPGLGIASAYFFWYGMYHVENINFLFSKLSWRYSCFRQVITSLRSDTGIGSTQSWKMRDFTLWDKCHRKGFSTSCVGLSIFWMAFRAGDNGWDLYRSTESALENRQANSSLKKAH